MSKNNGLPSEQLLRRRKIVEIVSTSGLLLVAVGLIVPFAAIENAPLALAMRIVYAVGAIAFTVARMINVNAQKDSARLRRLRRMEMWAGFCFIIGGAFWFYNAQRFSFIPFSLPVMRDTVAFTMAGAIIQVVASWLITSRMRKESEPK